MKATELRIGNSILMNGEVVHNIGYGVIMDLHQINKDLKNEYLNTLKFKPIPLTEEWLLKFGWVWNEECNSYEKYPNGDARMNLTYTYFGYVMFNYVLKAEIRKGIYYIHQLQNLYFALTGEELKIKEYETI